MSTTCAIHTQAPVAGYCRTCGKPICTECKRDVHGVIYCEDCLAARVQSTLPPLEPNAPAGAPPKVVVESGPSVGLATFLGFIPGVGAMYNGQFVKAFVHILIFATLAAAADRADIFGFFVAAFFAYMVVDAHQTAKARLYGRPLPDLIGLDSFIGNTRPGVDSQVNWGETWRQNRAPVGALILIGLGTLFLLDNFELFHFRWFDRLWPLLLIGLGVWWAYRRSHCGVLRSELPQ